MFDVEAKEANVSSLELLLMRRLEKAFEAVDAHQGEIFDEIVEEMEMLFKLKPKIYKQLLAYKEELTKNITILAERAGQLAGAARNEIQRRAFYEGEVDSIEWDARKDYLDQIVSIMGTNQMIPMETVEPATLERAEPIEEAPEEEEETTDEPEEKPLKKKDKPKLSFTPKKSDKEFEV